MDILFVVDINLEINVMVNIATILIAFKCFTLRK